MRGNHELAKCFLLSQEGFYFIELVNYAYIRHVTGYRGSIVVKVLR
jgi:hypothetical protein